MRKITIVLAASVATLSCITCVPAASAPAVGSGTQVAAIPARALTGYRQAPQQRSWWCGPASAYTIVAGLKYYRKISTTNSRPEGWGLSQRNLAQPRYLDAVSDGTYRTHMRNGLNRWIGHPGWYDVLSNPTPAQFTSKLVGDIRTGYAVAVAALERAGGYHYNNHPANRTVDHWVVARGYSYNVVNTHFVDPATSVWSGVRPYFAYNTTNFVNRFVRPSKAIVW